VNDLHKNKASVKTGFFSSGATEASEETQPSLPAEGKKSK
jgi:hypothetical protein